MPGVDLPEYFTMTELQAMDPDRLAVAQANGFRKDLTAAATASAPEEQVAAAPPSDPYSPNVWGSKEFDFTVPSGQRCRLRRLEVEKLLEEGILDRVSRLPGLAAELVSTAEGQPPQPAMPDREQVRAVVELTNTLLPLAVVAPVISRMPDPEAEDPRDRTRQPDRLYPDDVDIFDRVAIMERLLKGVKSMDKFRHSGAAVAGVVDVKGSQGPAL